MNVDATCRITSHARENVKPAPNWLKCNVDCALFTNKGCFGVKICSGDNVSRFIQARAMLFSSVSHVIECEVTLQLAIQIATYMSLERVKTNMLLMWCLMVVIMRMNLVL